MENRIEAAFQAQAALYSDAAPLLAGSLAAGARLVCNSIARGGKILICGNGGSAADAQHLAAELVVQLTCDSDRSALSAIALTTDSSILTAIANDYGFNSVFSRQVAALGRAGDLLIGISTSGTSTNVLEAIATAKSVGMHTLLMSGYGVGPGTADLVLAVPSSVVSTIQEMHIFCGHLMIGLSEDLLRKEGYFS